MNLIQTLEKEQVEKLSAGKTIPEFGPGDTVLVNVKVKEGDKSRVQAYEGVCIARSGHGLNANFTVRKISYGEGVERVFPLYGPVIDSMKVVRRGKVRRAKLYYLRDLRGKKARIEAADRPRRRTRPKPPPPSNGGVDIENCFKGPAFGPFCLRATPMRRDAPFRCRNRFNRLYSPHGFQGSAHHPRRPHPPALAVFRPADGRPSRTLIGSRRHAGACEPVYPISIQIHKVHES